MKYKLIEDYEKQIAFDEKMIETRKAQGQNTDYWERALKDDMEELKKLKEG